MAVTEEPRIQARRPPAPGTLIDPKRYTSREFHRLEFERHWPRVWQLACFGSDVAKPGDYFEYVIGDWSVVIVRQDDGGLKAYHNVCRHRGRRIKTGCGNAKELQCPYHLWTWALDGRLKNVPERDTYCEFADDEAGLVEVTVDQWQDWIFVDLGGQAGPLMDYLGELPELMAPYRLDRQHRWWNRSTRCRVNWKAMVDAFNESYHARAIHPESVTFINFTDHEVRLLGDHSTMTLQFGTPDVVSVPTVPDYEEMMDAMEWTFAAFGEDTAMVDVLRQFQLEPGQQLRDLLVPLMRAGTAASNIDVSGLDDSQLIDFVHLYVFPNVQLNLFSYGHWMFRILPDSDDPDYSTIEMWYFHRIPDTVEDVPLPDPHQVIPEGESCGPVMDQDLGNLPSHQAGLKDPAATGLRLSSLEARIIHMHDVLDRSMAGD